MSVNIVVQDGVVKSPSLKYDSQSRPEFRFTLVQMEKDWPLYLPCCAVGGTAERLASQIDDGQHILVTSGKLCYRKRQTKAGEQSRMEILVWTVDRLTASAQVERSDDAAYPSQGEPVAVAPEPKVRKPRYPKWTPEHAN